MALRFDCKHCGEEIISKYLKIRENAECKSCGKLSRIPNFAEDITEPTKKKNHNLGDAFNGNETTEKILQNDIQKSEIKYPALDTIAIIYRIIAVLLGFVSVCVLIYGVYLLGSYNEQLTGAIIIVYSLVIGLIGVISLLGISEGIKLSISIEENTSKQNVLLNKLINKIT